jgi:hypothetical protein
MTMDAVAATIVLGGQAILFKYRGGWKYINIYFNFSVTTIFLQPVPSPNLSARSPVHWIVWIDQILVAGGASGSATMVAVFVAVCCV